jgi:curved DNA-binding protein CbpA
VTTTSSDDFVFAWVQVLDELTYYELFGIAPVAGAAEVRAAFHAFCDTFHPDRHSTRPEGEREAVASIFKRGTEAYLVLSDSGLRDRYDAELSAGGAPKPPRISFSPASRRPPPSRVPGAVPLDESVRSPSARPFARRAEELVRKGDLRQAKLQLVMANHMDPDNPALEEALKKLEKQLAPRK